MGDKFPPKFSATEKIAPVFSKIPSATEKIARADGVNCGMQNEKLKMENAEYGRRRAEVGGRGVRVSREGGHGGSFHAPLVAKALRVGTTRAPGEITKRTHLWTVLRRFNKLQINYL